LIRARELPLHDHLDRDAVHHVLQLLRLPGAQLAIDHQAARPEPARVDLLAVAREHQQR
jgi:hypothetical protein